MCNGNSNTLETYCLPRQKNQTPYSTSLERCGTNPDNCSGLQMLSPASCDCQVPYKGTLTCMAPSFRDLTNAKLFEELEGNLCSNLSLPAHSAFLQNPYFDQNNYLKVQLSLFPSSGKFFNHLSIQTIGFTLSNQNFMTPNMFGPCIFHAFPYPFPCNLTIIS